MVDIFTLALTHGLMALALWRLLSRPELDVEESAQPLRPWIKRKPPVRDSQVADGGSSDA